MNSEIAERALSTREKRQNKLQVAQVSFLLSYFNQNKIGRLLEVGCGYGFFTKIAHQHSCCTVAIDLEKGLPPSALRLGINFAKANGCLLPFENNSFDCVFSVDVLEHVENDSGFLQESVRVLKPGGTLIVGTPNRERFSLKLRSLLLIKTKYPISIGSDPIFGDVIHIREYTKSEFIEVKGIYLGLLGKYPMGLKFPPNFLERYCQFWFIRAKKT
jgi:SAM-dependent methyltransferase